MSERERERERERGRGTDKHFIEAERHQVNFPPTRERDERRVDCCFWPISLFLSLYKSVCVCTCRCECVGGCMGVFMSV